MLEILDIDKRLCLFGKAFDCSINAICITDLEGSIIFVNDSAVKQMGYEHNQEMLGRHISEFWEGDRINNAFEELHCNGFTKGEDIGKRKDGSLFYAECSANIIRDDCGEPLAIFGSFVDISKRKIAQMASDKKQQELEKKSKELEEANAALKAILKKMGENTIEFENNILSNVNTLIKPYLDELKDGRLSKKHKMYLEIIQTNLNEIVSPFARHFSSTYYQLTPQEIQIASHIKNGKTTKEIAEIMGRSTKTIEFHRTHIRKKLGLAKRSDNLRSHLMFLK